MSSRFEGTGVFVGGNDRFGENKLALLENLIELKVSNMRLYVIC